jgi:hypothetical protein
MPKDNAPKIGTFRSLSRKLAITFSVLVAVTLLIAGSVQTYFSSRAQWQNITDRQGYVAEEAAGVVSNFIREKIATLEVATSLGNVVNFSDGEKSQVLEKILGTESAFRQLIFIDRDSKETLRASRLSKSLSARSIKYEEKTLFSK